MGTEGNEALVLAGFSDAGLVASIESVCFGARRFDVRLLLLLGEIEERKLHLRMACSSIFDFCRRKLHMSEGEASRRMVASRLVRKLPGLIPHIESGRIHLTTLSMLRDFLTESNVEELVAATDGKTKNQVKELIAAMAPRPDVPARIRKLPDVAPSAPSSSPGASSSSAAASGAVRAASEASVVPGVTPSLFAREGSGGPPAPAPRTSSRPHAGRIEPLAPTRYKLEMTIGTEERDKLERVRDLMRHRLPSGDLTVIFGAALDLLVAKLEKEILGTTTRPRAPAKSTRAAARSTRAPHRQSASSDALAQANAAADALMQTDAHPQADAEARANVGAADDAAEANARSRYVRRAVRRAVFERDGAQCTYRDAEGNRCPARGFLQLDHIDAFGLGGEATVENLRVRCGPHNHMHAEDTYGAGHVASRIEMRQRR